MAVVQNEQPLYFFSYFSFLIKIMSSKTLLIHCSSTDSSHSGRSVNVLPAEG